jgi:glycosyltransferase involved in cell wall biosynthesis
MSHKVGAICRMDSTGLGIQSKEFFDHIPCKALVVDVSRVNQSMKQNHEWYPNSPIVYFTRVPNFRFNPAVIKDFLKGLEVLVAFETPYDFTIFPLAKLMGIKTVLQLNYEFLDYPSNLPAPDLFAAPSLWHYDEIPDPKVFLPVPVNTNHFRPVLKEKTFVHIAGKPAVHDRNGTYTFLKSLKYVRNDIKVILKCQDKIKLPELAKLISEVPPHISITQDYTNHPNYWDNYTGGVLVLPRKYGGLSLGINESIAAEMPVIATDISPNFTWLPKEWLVPAKKTGSFQCKKPVDIYEADERLLAGKIDQFCEQQFYYQQVIAAKEIKKRISWETLLPEYYRVLLG